MKVARFPRRALVVCLLVLSACDPAGSRVPKLGTERDALGCSTAQIDTHAAVCDSGGKLLSWAPVASPDLAFDAIIGLDVGYFAARPSVTATDRNGNNPLSVPPFYSVSYLCSGVSPGCSPAGGTVGWPQNNAGLAQMLTESGLDLYAYSADRRIIDVATTFLTHHLDHALSPSTGSWVSVPFTDGQPGQYDFHGFDATTGVGDGVGYLEPEKVAAMGYAFAQAYEFNGNTRFRDAAVHIANQMFSHQVTAGLSATVSPWYFRTRASDNVPRTQAGEKFASNVVDALRLYTEVIKLGNAGKLGGAAEYSGTALANWGSGKASVLSWLLGANGPVINSQHLWVQYFEDVGAATSLDNFNQLVPMETAKYLLDHPEDDPSWSTHVSALLAWVKTHFQEGSVNGATTIAEQNAFFHAMGSHTSRYAAVNARYAELTGNAAAQEEGFRSFNWATYMTHANGLTVDGPAVENVWFSDSWGDFLRHFFIGMAAIPDWAPSTQSHLLRSSSVVQSVTYAAAQVSYQTADASAREVLRLSFTPTSVTAGGVALAQVPVLATSQGWKLDTTTDAFGHPRNALRIRHDASGAIVVLGSTLAPTVAFTQPTAGQNFVAPATLTLSATVTPGSGRTLPAGAVKFLEGTTVLCTPAQTASPYSCTASAGLADGNHTLTAQAIDSAGTPGSATVSITVSAAPTVAITSPTAGSTVPVGPVTLTASASAGTGRSLASVTFKNGATVLCSATASPYSCSFTAAAGAFSITATALDSGSPAQSRVSAAVAFTVSGAASSVVLLGQQPATVPTATDFEDAQTTDAWPLTATASGAVATLGLYVDASNTATTVLLGVYADSAGAPGARLTSCSATTPAGTAGWVTCAASPAVTLASGTAYWIATLNPTAGKNLHWREQSGAGGSYSHSAAGQTALANPAAALTGSYPGSGLVAYAASAGSASAPPTASITSPANGVNFAATANVALVASVAPGSGRTLTRAEFFLSGSSTPVCTVNAPGASPSCSVTLTDGSYSYTVRATDDLSQQTTSAPVTLTVSRPPVVSITSPANGATVSAGTVTLTASASAGTGRSLTSVVFQNGATPLCTATASPWSCSFTAAAGTYALTALATDNGAPASSTLSAGSTLTVTAAATLPLAPSALSATATSSTVIHLAWTDNAGNETGFRLERAPDSAGSAGTYAEIAVLGANVTTTDDSGRAASTRYWYRVRAYNGTGTSAYSSAVSVTTPGAGGTVLLGNTAVAAADDDSPAGTAEAFSYPALASGTLSTLKVYMGAASSTAFQVALYASAGSPAKPSTRLGVCSISAPAANAWNSCTLGAGVSVSAGTVYWIAVLGTAGGTLRFKDDGVQGFGNGSFASSASNLTALPATFTSGTGYTSAGASFYGTN